jgi:hypothetical protein
MAGFFAESFLIRASLPADAASTNESAYDEARSLTVLADGRPLVEAVATAETTTITKATGEADDWQSNNPTVTEAKPERDVWAVAGLSTRTEAAPESDDWTAPPSRPGTETQTFATEEHDLWS